MGTRESVLVSQTYSTNIYTGGGTNYLIQTPTGVLYLVYIDTNADAAFKKSTDGGLTWSNSTVLKAATVVQLSVWYDRWSGIDADVIHVSYSDSSSDDVFYRSIDTGNSDTLSAEVVIFAGASTANPGPAMSISRARGGYLSILFDIDNGAEKGFYKSTDAGANWSAMTDGNEAGSDKYILLPGWAADNQDMMAFFWDSSADEISRKLYDDSGNSWAETSIASSMVDVLVAASFSHMDAFVDIANSQNVLVAWSAVDAENADLRCWAVTESTITEKTNVVLNSTDDQGLTAVGLNTQTGYWHVFYAGKSDGSETWSTAVNIYTKISKDGGTTWGDELQLTDTTRSTAWLITCPRFTGQYICCFHSAGTMPELMLNVSTKQPRATYLIGV